MRKAFIFGSLAAMLYSSTIGGVAILVKNEPITLYDLQNEMRLSNLSQNDAVDSLIRKKLEQIEIDERHLSVNVQEVHEDIKAMAEQNHMSVSELYDAMLRVRGLTSEQLKEKIEEKLLGQKLYNAIAFSKLSQPTEQDEAEYYQLHLSEFRYAERFAVVLYNAASREQLQTKIDNPMFYSPEIRSEETTLEYAKLNPQLAQLLTTTPLNSFTPVIPGPNNSYISFFIKEKNDETTLPLEKVRSQITNAIMQERRTQVLNDYFARLRMNADIQVLRLE